MEAILQVKQDYLQRRYECNFQMIFSFRKDVQEMLAARSAPAPAGSINTADDPKLLETALHSKIFKYERMVVQLFHI